MRVSGLENCALLKIALNPHRLNRSARNKNSVNVFTLQELIHHTACTVLSIRSTKRTDQLRTWKHPGRPVPMRDVELSTRLSR